MAAGAAEAAAATATLSGENCLGVGELAFELASDDDCDGEWEPGMERGDDAAA